MKIAFHGAVREVTGSRHLLEVGGRKILLECGLFQGKRDEADAKCRNFPFDPREIDAVILSHAHIDHSGNLPRLVKQGYDGPIHATSATVGLLEPMLRDSAHIQERDVEFVNKRLARQGKPPRKPLYRLGDVENTLPHLLGHAYHTPFEVVPGVRATFYDAGHILGSAIVVLDLEEEGRSCRFCFTGDLGRPNLPIIRDPEVPEGVDVLVIESTYGDRLHEEYESIAPRLAELLSRAHKGRGKVIVPAFAVGRTQEVVRVMKEIFESGQVPRMPVYVDSPLAVDVTEVFREHDECFDEETLQLLFQEHTDPFGFRLMHYIRDVEASKALNEQPGPMVIISPSGMCEAGRVLHHLRNNIEKPSTMILIVGFQAQNTLARRLAERRSPVRIFGEEFELKAEVHVFDAFSAHADRDELLGWVRRLDRPPRQCFVVHGEEEQSLAFAGALEGEGLANVVVPELGLEYRL